MFKKISRVVLVMLTIAVPAVSRPQNKPQNGTSTVVVAITPQQSELVLHEPLNLVLRIRNASKEAAEIDLGIDRDGGITIESELPDGTEKVGRIRFHGSVLRRGQITLAPGQSYAQNLMINRWTEFAVPGLYRIAVLLDNPVKMQNGSTMKLGPITVSAVVRERNDDALRRFCEGTLIKLLAADNYNEAVNAAETLSYVHDPIAIPYLRRAFQTPQPVRPVLVNGLETIGSDEAIEVLLEMLGKEPGSESGYLRNALDRLAAKTTDTDVRRRIRAALEEK